MFDYIMIGMGNRDNRKASGINERFFSFKLTVVFYKMNDSFL